jgi:hypothetical protein
MEWVGGLFFVIFLGLWGFVAYMEHGAKPQPSNLKEAEAWGKANPLEDWQSERRAVRKKEHNAWLLMWYNALPQDRKNFFQQVWSEQMMKTPWMLHANRSDERHRKMQEFLLMCAANMVEAVLDPSKSFANLAMPEADVTEIRVGHVRADRIRSASMLLDGAAAVSCPTAAAEARREERKRAMAEKCATCGCGPNSAC